MALKVLVTGAAGSVGNIGRYIVQNLLSQNIAVRALVRTDDERAQSLRELGAEVVIGDLTVTSDVVKALQGCTRVYFGMSVSPDYLQATTIAAAVAREQGNIEVFVNMSQMTVSEMSLSHQTDSHQQQQHWLSEHVLNWSGLPLVHVRPTVFAQHPFFLPLSAQSIKRDSSLHLPFGDARVSPVDTRDVAEVVALILAQPGTHIGKVYQLTGPRSQNLEELAEEYSKALGRKISYVPEPLERWINEDLRKINLPEHTYNHLSTMAKLVAAGKYDRWTDDVEKLLGRPARSMADFVAFNINAFQ